MYDLAVAMMAMASLGLLRRRWPTWAVLEWMGAAIGRFARFAALADGARSAFLGYALYMAMERRSDRLVAVVAMALAAAPLPDGTLLDLLLGGALALIGRHPSWAVEGAQRAALGTLWASRLPMTPRHLFLLVSLPREFSFIF